MVTFTRFGERLQLSGPAFLALGDAGIERYRCMACLRKICKSQIKLQCNIKNDSNDVFCRPYLMVFDMYFNE